MRIALFSDIHGNLPGLQAVLARLDQHAAESGPFDALFCLGDMIGGGPATEEVLDILIERQARMVLGNHDLLEIDFENQVQHIPPEWKDLIYRTRDWMETRLGKPYRDFLAALPLVDRFEVAPGHTLAVCHAAPTDPWGRVCRPDETQELLDLTFRPLQAEVVAYGHYHSHHVLWHDGMLLLNVASVGLRKDGLSAYTLLEYTTRWSVQQYQVAYDVQEEQRLMRERGVPQP